MTENVWPVVELRQYTLRPGTRDVLIELFDRELVETQEAVGMRIVAQFRDEDDPDRFVWVRAFRDIESRGAALTAFYVDGETWRTHAPAARATMVDTTNALLLQPASATSGFALAGERPGAHAAELPESRVLATIYYLDTPADEFAEFFDSRVRPLLAATGAPPIACYLTDPAPNTFAALPVRSETVFVWFALFDTADQRAEHLDRLAAAPTWTAEVQPELAKRLSGPIERLRLAPTARSLLR
ncbi:NIPSNAP family protein [Nocardia iowensis]|uniref:NIPSNAP family protein n=1 Tax=Nocardia iowensis TaxID=204891 RepID=A0ABX8RTL8_NOCIO|nr:NIPSNAP family protein [Nocardia iowensis]QXN92938.1 NIPSNAP family protein [Nocardia iowensis]